MLLDRVADAPLVRLVTAVPRRLLAAGEDLSSVLRSARVVEERALRLLDDVEALVVSIRASSRAADRVIADAGATQDAAGRVVDQCAAQLRQTERMLADLAGPAGAARPATRRVAEVIEPRHVDGAAQLLDLVPDLLDLVLPALRGLSELSPNMNQLGERLDNIAHIVEGMPGADALKRRGAERIHTR